MSGSPESLSGIEMSEIKSQALEVRHAASSFVRTGLERAILRRTNRYNNGYIPAPRSRRKIIALDGSRFYVARSLSNSPWQTFLYHHTNGNPYADDQFFFNLLEPEHPIVLFQTVTIHGETPTIVTGELDCTRSLASLDLLKRSMQ